MAWSECPVFLKHYHVEGERDQGWGDVIAPIKRDPDVESGSHAHPLCPLRPDPRKNVLRV